VTVLIIRWLLGSNNNLETNHVFLRRLKMSRNLRRVDHDHNILIAIITFFCIYPISNNKLELYAQLTDENSLNSPHVGMRAQGIHRISGFRVSDTHKQGPTLRSASCTWRTRRLVCGSMRATRLATHFRCILWKDAV
jgi:hypothetical protein